MIAATSARLTKLTASKSKRGFTLTEIAIVLGIIGLILGAIWAAASSVYSNQKSNNAQRGILATAQAVRSLYGTSATTGTTAPPLILPGVFPTDWQGPTPAAGGTPFYGNPWHLAPTLQSYSFIVPNNQLFAVELDGITDAGCASLLSFYGSSTAGSLGGSVPGLVATTYAAGAPGGGPVTAIPGVDPGAIASAGNFAPPGGCVGGDNNNNISVVFSMSQM